MKARAVCLSPNCPHEKRLKELELEKAAKSLPMVLLPRGEVHAGQLCEKCEKPIPVGAWVLAAEDYPAVVCEVCYPSGTEPRPVNISLSRKKYKRREWIISKAV